MGKVKSIRFNDRTERMFNVVKNYYAKKEEVNDSEIIAKGIELQYDVASDELNGLFRKRMKSLIDAEFSRQAFESLCNMLEILSVSRGSLLQDEFWGFIKVSIEGELFYGVSEGSKELLNRQYEKIYETMTKTFVEKPLKHTLDEFKDCFYKMFGKEYCEK